MKSTSENGTKRWNTAIYVRTATFETFSYPAQETILSEFVKQHANELTLEGTYIDNGFSGNSTNRPELNRLLADIDAGTINCIVVRSISRLSRDCVLTLALLKKLEQMNVRLISISSPQLNTTKPTSILKGDALANEVRGCLHAAQKKRGHTS